MAFLQLYALDDRLLVEKIDPLDKDEGTRKYLSIFYPDGIQNVDEQPQFRMFEEYRWNVHH